MYLRIWCCQRYCVRVLGVCGGTVIIDATFVNDVISVILTVANVDGISVTTSVYTTTLLPYLSLIRDGWPGT